MQFNNYYFILYFLPIILILYFTLGKINDLVRKLILIVGSFIFYAYADFKLSLILVISLILNYSFAKLCEKKQQKSFFLAPTVINICLLLVFKYTNFAISNINTLFNQSLQLKTWALPLGISFFTFSQISYITAICKEELKTNLIDYLTYILFFPKLIMGPLMEPDDFLGKLNDTSLHKINWDNIAFGIKSFSFGLFKKALLADTFAVAVNWGFSHTDKATSIDWLLIMLFYTFEIYFDFSGYTDMAVGTSIMFNIELPMNFDSPYKAVSIRDFWKRWHISLTKFWTKYVYIPLGGSKKGDFMTCVNMMVVFLVSGLWHGANWTFILWGVLHGAFSIIERITPDIPVNKITKPLKTIWTFIIVNILWLLFRAESVSQWFSICKTIVKLEEKTISSGLIKKFNLPEADLIFNNFPTITNWNDTFRGLIMCIFILASCIICFVPENNYRTLKKISIISILFAALAFIWGITCLGGESVFVYNNF